MLIYEFALYQTIPNLYSLIGSGFCFAGVIVLKDQIAPAKIDGEEVELGGVTEGKKEDKPEGSISFPQNIGSNVPGGNFTPGKNCGPIEFPKDMEEMHPRLRSADCIDELSGDRVEMNK